jgi:hypothetical protein
MPDYFKKILYFERKSFKNTDTAKKYISFKACLDLVEAGYLNTKDLTPISEQY